MTQFDVIDRGLAEGQQDIINLTDPNYDAYTELLEFELNVTLQKTITIEYRDLNDGYYYWGYPDLKWGEPGVKWGATADTWTDKATLSSVTNTGYNSNAISTILTEFETKWGYLAIGSGVPVDDSTSLTSELTRIPLEQIEYIPTGLRLQYTLDENTINNTTIQECGLAIGATGDISTIAQFSKYDKTSQLILLFSIMAQIKLI